MGLVADLTAPFRAASTLAEPEQWFMDAIGGRKTVSGENVTLHAALTVATFYAGVRCISEDIGKLPFITYKRLKPRGKERFTDHPAYALLHDAPNPEMTAMAFREAITSYALTSRFGLAEIVRDQNGTLRELWPIHPSRITAERTNERGLFYVIQTDLGTVQLNDENVLNIHGLGDGWIGYELLDLAAETLGVAIAQRKHGAAFFGNHAQLGNVLEYPGQLDDAAKQRIRSSFGEVYGGSEQAYKLYILEEGMKLATSMAIDPEKAQMVDWLKAIRIEIASMLRMAPHKLQILDHATFSNIEHQGIEHVTDTLTPWAVRWEQECKRKLFADESDVFAELLFTGLLRGDQAARSAYYRERFNIGTLSQNDIREFENENPIEDGDIYFVPMNLRPWNEPFDAGESTQIGPPSDGRDRERASAAPVDLERIKRIYAEWFATVVDREVLMWRRKIPSEAHAGRLAGFLSSREAALRDYLMKPAERMAEEMGAIAPAAIVESCVHKFAVEAAQQAGLAYRNKHIEAFLDEFAAAAPGRLAVELTERIGGASDDN